jgi:hypothetical protein
MSKKVGSNSGPGSKIKGGERPAECDIQSKHYGRFSRQSPENIFEAAKPTM